jgi:hypothetical protein
VSPAGNRADQEVEVNRDRVVQRQGLDWGEPNTNRLHSRQYSVEVLDEHGQFRQLRLFTDRDQPAPNDPDVVEVKLASIVVRSPRRGTTR